MQTFHKDLSQFKEIKLYCIGDLHLEDPLNNYKQAIKWRNEVLSQENNFVIVNGDILNFATKTSKSDVYNQKYNPDKAIDKAIEFFQPIKDRILIIVPGNHEDRGRKGDGVKVVKQIAARLFGEEEYKNYYTDAAYLLFISFGMSQNRDYRKMIYSLYGKHGSGGGKTVGSKLNNVAAMAGTIDADIYLHSHTHLPAVFKQDFIRSDYRNRKTTQVTHMFVNTNAFLNFGGYGEALGFNPSSCDYPVIILNGIERKMNAIL